MNCYCDSSFFLRQFIPSSSRLEAIELATELAQRIGFIPLTSLTRFEVIQALRFESWRNRNDRTKGLPGAQVDAALNLFVAEIGSAFRIIPVNWDDAFLRAELLSRSTSDNGWRTLDLIHVATAIVSGATTFYSYDQVQNLAASREGLQTPLRGLTK
jgi:predicted nucleic acid-binding protein